MYYCLPLVIIPQQNIFPKKMFPFDSDILAVSETNNK